MIDQINDLTDTDFEKLGVTAIGIRIKIKQAVQDYKRANGCSPSSAVKKFLELQQKKTTTKIVKRMTTKKCSRRVYVGWKHLVAPGKYKVMSTKEGGGQQKVDLDKDLSIEDATKQILAVYFPNGRSVSLSLSEVSYHLASFTNEDISSNQTVGQYFDTVRSHPVRWYFSTKAYIH